MAKQLNVNLAFNADTQQAKRAIQDLSNSLQKIQVKPAHLFDDIDLKAASKAAQDLEKHLQAAVNVDTGKLDLNKFSQSLAASNQTLGDLYRDLSRVGDEGSTAFLHLAKSINTADSSTLNLGSKLRELSTTLKNTVRWEISSKVMHGFESAISSAYNYAQDLNKSLNDIRIVIGSNADEMARFAENANKAARQLSTTTTDYTNASLIYFQQGLSDAEVAERTEVTIKMANAAGVSAQTVSDQMTAVWNNFDNGSKSLEYYADVMTALGAATASSTDEISEGLNKFAAVAETVGLSYEYATAALATVTSETRESADVVGTAYKTLFARIQGLQQGDTLEDGTTLNKYSTALAKVGINIKDVNGEMKSMDTILNEMGAKWGTLAKDQQLALAQTVAGVRQYNQLVALMDNWGTFQQNLDIAYNSEGTLQKQADIYAESWEAASKRVQAAAQGIFEELLNDEFFIDILDGFELLLTGLNNVIDGVGGLKTILLTVGGLFIRQYAKEIPNALSTLSSNFDIITGKAKKTKQEMMDSLVTALNKEDVSSDSSSMNAEIQTITKVSEMNAELNRVRETLSDTELAYYQTKIKHIEAYGAEAVAIGKERDALEKLIETKKAAAAKEAVRNNETDLKNQDTEIEKLEKALVLKQKLAQESQAKAESYKNESTIKMEAADAFKESGDQSNYIIYKQQALDLERQATEQVAETERILKEVQEAEAEINSLKEKRGKTGQTDIKEVRQELQALQDLSKQYYTLYSAKSKIKDQTKTWETQAKLIKDNAKETDKMSKSIVSYIKHLSEIGLITDDVTEIIAALEKGDMTAEEMVNTFRDIRIDDTKISGFEEKIEAISDKLIKMGVSVKTLDDLAVQFEEGALSAEEYWQALNRLEQESAELPKHNMSISESFGVMAGTMMQLWSVITSLKGIGSIWNSEDLSIGEKIFQTISSLIPAIITLTQITGEHQKAQLADAGATLAASLGLVTKTAATTGATVATKGLTGALQKLYITLGPIGFILVIIAAAMAALALAAWGLGKAFEWIKSKTPEGRLAALEEEANRASDAFSRVSESVKETEDALKSLNEQYDAIENLTKGTLEWYQAVSSVNAEIMSLIDKYPELQQYVYQDDGILHLNEDGQAALMAAQYSRLEAAQNVKTRADIDVRQEELDQRLNDYDDNNRFFKNKYQDDIVSELAKLYNNPQFGEQLFTQTGSAEVLNSLNLGDQTLDSRLLKGNHQTLTAEDYENFYKDLIANEELIKKIATEQQYIQTMQDSLFANRVQATGTNRSLEEVKTMLGGVEYEDLFQSSRDKVESTFGDWNDHINYKKGGTYTTDAEWKMIEDFMNLQGDDVEYVAQRNGKMVLEVGDDEIEYSKDEVYDALAELYTGPELEKRLTESLTQTLTTSLKGVNLTGLDLDELVQLDNISMAFENALVGTNLEGNGSDLLNQIIESQGSDPTALQNWLADIQNIDLSNAENLREFNSAAQQLAEGTITIEEFTHALDEMNAAATLDNMDSFFADAAEKLGMSDEDAENMQNYAKHLMEIADESANLSDELTTNADSAADLAVEITRMNKGVKKLADGFDDWKDILKKSSRESAEYAEALWEMKDALGDILDVEKDLVSEEFIQKNMEQIEKASEGSAEAIDYLRSQMDEEIIQRVTLGQTEDFATEVMNMQTLFTNELNRINEELPDIEVGAILQDGDFIDAANNLVQAAGMTADEANAYFAGIGYEPVYAVDEIDNTSEVPQSQTSFMPEVLGTQEADMGIGPLNLKVRIPMISYNQVSTPLNPAKAPGTTRLVSFSGDGTAPAPIRGLRRKATGSSNNYSKTNSGGSPAKTPSKGGGGGSSKEKEPSKAKKIDVTGQEEIVERYKEINDSLDDLSDEYEKATRSADRLWGEHRLDAIREQNELIKEQQELLAEKQKQAENYMKQDQIALQQAAAQAGLSFSFDENGNISNYTDQMTNLYNQLAAAEAHYNSLATGEDQEAYEETILEPLKDKIKAVEDAIEIYEESKELFEELGLDIEDLQDQIMQNNYDIIMEGLELHISFNEEDLENIDYYLSKLGDDFYSMAEAAALMADFGGGSQLDEYLDNLSEYENAMAQLRDDHDAGKITDAAFQEGLAEIRSNILDNLESILELDKAMSEYYGDTLAAAGEEIAKFTDRMEHQADVLEHFASMMEILGKETDYKSMGIILQGQADVAADELEVAKRTYALYKQEAEEKKALYDQAMSQGDHSAAEIYKKEWEAAEEATREAQAEMLDKTEEWAEAMKAVVENNLAGIAQTLEETLTGGTSFDEMTNALERAASLQEEYLTTTNQIYETNKLMRTAQQEIDKTTNDVAKRRLKDFVAETAQLQDKNKLSTYELEIQQAKYDLLLAEIALEEAQNAKSTVRLQRDAEGNFGYVYTADQDQVAKAQQELEDAQNSLYNIALEGANNYTEKYAETLQEMYDTLTSIQEAWLNGEIATQEEYDRQMLAAQEYYYQQLQDFSELYTVAVTTDNRVVRDAWSSGFSDMIYKTNDWQAAVGLYAEQAKGYLVDWYAQVAEISNQTGLDNIAAKVDAVTTETEELRDTLLGTDGKEGVIKAIEDELDAVSNLTGEYANLREEIQALIADYEDLMKTVNNAQNQQASDSQKTDTGNGDTSGSGSSNSDNNSSGSGQGNSSTSGGGSTGSTPSSGQPSLSVGQNVTIKQSATHFSRDGGNGTRMRSFVPGSTYTVMDFDDDEVMVGRNGVVTGWVRKTDIVGFNTGGYTGEWGPYGKLAILDEKELVLNENDTANFLASIEVLERILEMIDLQAASTQLGGLLTTPNYGGSTQEILEQNIHIEASFPAVTDRNEIEEAFNTLVNRASQYANRK